MTTTLEKSILSRQPDACGYYYGFLPCGRQLNVRSEPDGWRAYVCDLVAVASGSSKEEAERLGIEWAAANVDA